MLALRLAVLAYKAAKRMEQAYVDKRREAETQLAEKRIQAERDKYGLLEKVL